MDINLIIFSIIHHGGLWYSSMVAAVEARAKLRGLGIYGYIESEHGAYVVRI